MPYQITAYSELPSKTRSLYDYLVRYHRAHGGRRASRAEMRDALHLSRDPLNGMLAALEGAGLFETETDAQGKARSYTLPSEKWHHPHLSTIEIRQSFTIGSIIESG